jgi:hypothetical protein
MLASAVQSLGLTLGDVTDCHRRVCVAKIERASRKVLQIAWKPISVFPNEARRFQ